MPIFPKYNGPPLIEQVCRVENMTLAWQRVRSNIQVARRGRSAGPDAVTLRDFEADWPRQMALLVDELRGGRYRPLLPRMVAIPKASGGTRAIAILAVRDRIAQRAVQQVIEPLFDPLFYDCSCGCRPRVNVADAIARVARYAEQGLTWVVDADIENYYDSLDQRILQGLLRQRIDEVAILRLIALWLESGAAALAENDPLPGETHDGWRLFERGRQVVQQLFNGQPAPLVGPNDPYAAGAWEQPGGESWPGAAPSVSMPYAGNPLLGDHSPVNTLWTALMLARPLMDGARRALPYVQRLGRQRLLVAGTVAAGAVALAEVVLRWQQAAQRGTMQGGSLSPLLANIYLHPFDMALTSQGLRLVRFMDDFVVMCASQAEAERTLTLVERQLAELRLTLNRSKTRIVNYADGLEFLGQALAPRRRGPRLAEGLTSFEEADKMLRAVSGRVRRPFQRKR